MVSQNDIVPISRIDDVTCQTRNDDIIATVHCDPVSTAARWICACQRSQLSSGVERRDAIVANHDVTSADIRNCVAGRAAQNDVISCSG